MGQEGSFDFAMYVCLYFLSFLHCQVPFGPLAFMPGKLVHTNEVTVLLGDNWFAKCSAKQAGDLVEHRKKRMYCYLYRFVQFEIISSKHHNG